MQREFEERIATAETLTMDDKILLRYIYSMPIGEVTISSIRRFFENIGLKPQDGVRSACDLRRGELLANEFPANGEYIGGGKYSPPVPCWVVTRGGRAALKELGYCD
jgi:hypothetical protein